MYRSFSCHSSVNSIVCQLFSCCIHCDKYYMYCVTIIRTDLKYAEDMHMLHANVMLLQRELNIFGDLGLSCSRGSWNQSPTNTEG